jgi:hypothetical protein
MRVAKLTAGTLVIALLAGCKASSSVPSTPPISTVHFGPLSVTASADAIFWLHLLGFGLTLLLGVGITYWLTTVRSVRANGQTQAWHRWTRNWRRSSLAVALLGAGSAASAWLEARWEASGTFALLCGLTAGMPIGMLLSARRRNDKLSQLTLSDIELPVGTLVEMLSEREHHAREYAAVELTRILTGILPVEYEALTDAQRKTLYRQLDGTDPLLSRAILNAVGRLEDTHALPYVEKLVTAQSRTASDHPDHYAAIDCMFHLRQKTAEARPGQVLLRPADAADASLLRPAVDQASDTSLLVRPAGANE